MTGARRRGAEDRHAALERWVWWAAATAASAALFLLLTPEILGLFHDDAIYAAVAKSLAEGNGYHLVNLPGAPPQTKYPPGFSSLLALIWRVFPGFPENARALKSLNLVFVLIAARSLAAVTRAQNPTLAIAVPILAQLALVTNPGLVGFTDYTMTDVCFSALVVAAIAVFRKGERLTSWREAALISLVGGSILARSIGIALAAAIALTCAVRRQYARSLVYLGVGAAVFLVWTSWALAHRELSSPILTYYQEYESPALVHLLVNPPLAVSIVAGNVRMAIDALPLVVGPSWLGAWPALAALATAGMWRMLSTGWIAPVLFSACYLGLVLLHPFAPHRYLVPLMPIFVLAITAGAEAGWDLLRRVWPRGRASSLPAVIVLAIVSASNLVWVQYRLRSGETVRGWYGIDLGYRWSGFQETFHWIRTNTSADAKIGSLYDAMYFLYTGRQGVRPWIHRSETYFYPYGAASPDVGAPELVLPELRRLGIAFIVLDPSAGYVEGPAAMAMLRQLLLMPEAGAVRVFVSGDGEHEIYRLWTNTIPARLPNR